MARMALITGGSRGIGLSFAKALLTDGFYVTITGARSADALNAAVASLGDRFGPDRVAGVVADAGHPEHAERAVALAIERFGSLDILVNNAGRGPLEINSSFHRDVLPFWEIEPEGWSEIVQTNVTGPFLMARAAAPHMVRAGWGRIIGISTSLATMIKPGFAPYGPTKAALDTMTRIFAEDLKGRGVTCNILAPGGPTETDFIPAEGREGAYASLLPVDVMNRALIWLCSEASGDVTAARFIGKLWDDADPHAAREDTGQPPKTL
ncbi:MAG: SDR family oxidoreductase [Pseudomonadota bacterium]